MLRRLARIHRGVVSRPELVAAGVSARTVERAVAAGRLIPLYPGVYAVGHAYLRPDGFRRAAVKACGPGAALSHRSGAEHRGLVEDRRTVFDVTVPPGSARGRKLRGLVVHRARLTELDRSLLNGIPCTSVARTLADVAGSSSRRLVARGVDRALILRVYDQREMDEILRRPGRLRGVAILRSVLEDRHPDAHMARSELESRALERLDAASVPRAAINVWLPEAGVEVDLLWKEQRLVVELDGRRYHAHRTHLDRRRDATLEALGYRVLRYGWGDVTAGPFPEDVRAALR